MSNLYISYVSRDKEFANELTTALNKRGIETIDGRLGLGDSLSVSIRQGLQRASHVVLVLSQAFFEKSWPRFEFEEIDKLDREFTGGTRLLPIWHNIDPQRVSYFAPELAQRLGVSTRVHSMETIVAEIAEVVEDSFEAAGSSAPETAQFQKGFTPDPITRKSSTSPQVALRDNLNAYFSESELRSLCFDLGIEYENLGGRSKSDKVLELILMMQRYGRLQQLIDLVRQQRPHSSW
ncbi:MAG: toll/interleukin-1 receptor domain-containing protein [Anaerolineaceae bacterium]|nr:toll/interleukin-1 receptor domain-containing protein [Anaerolineaceae bacterium]